MRVTCARSPPSFHSSVEVGGLGRVAGLPIPWRFGQRADRPIDPFLAASFWYRVPCFKEPGSALHDHVTARCFHSLEVPFEPSTLGARGHGSEIGRSFNPPCRPFFDQVFLYISDLIAERMTDREDVKRYPRIPVSASAQCVVRRHISATIDDDFPQRHVAKLRRKLKVGRRVPNNTVGRDGYFARIAALKNQSRLGNSYCRRECPYNETDRLQWH